MNLQDRHQIYNAFLNGSLEVQSVSRGREIQWKTITDVMKHDVSNKDQFKINVGRTECSITCDHSLFKETLEGIEAVKTNDLVVGDNLIFIDNNSVQTIKLIDKIQISPMKYMFDLSVQDNENFILESGLLAHNSFRPPAKEKFIQGQTQVFGFIWEDEELLEYIYMAIDDFNTRPPITGLEVADLWGSMRRWRTAIILRAAAFACFAITMNWIADEFSVKGSERVTIYDEDGNDYSLTMRELFDIICEDDFTQIKKEVMEGIREIENENK